MNSFNFPLINVANSPFKRDYHTLFVKYQVLDVLINYQLSESTTSPNKTAWAVKSVDPRLTMVVYYDICKRAIHDYIANKVSKHADVFPNKESAVERIEKSLYSNYDPELFDIVLHKALNLEILRVYYNKTESYPEISKEGNNLTDTLPPFLIHANIHSRYTSTTDTVYKDMALPVCETMNQYNHIVYRKIDTDDISAYLTDYILIASSMGLYYHQYVAIIESVYEHIYNYIMEYGSVNISNTSCLYKLRFKEGNMFLKYEQLDEYVQSLNSLKERGLIKDDVVTNVLGLRIINNDEVLDDEDLAVVNAFVKEHNINEHEVNIDFLKTKTGRNIRWQHAYKLNHRSTSNLIQYYKEHFPNPEVNGNKYVENEHYNVIELSKKEYRTLYQYIRAIMLYKMIIVRFRLMEMCIRNAISIYETDNINEIKVFHADTSNVLTISGRHDYYFIDHMYTHYNLHMHLLHMVEHLKIMTNTTYAIRAGIHMKLNLNKVFHNLFIKDHIMFDAEFRRFYFKHVHFKIIRKHETTMYAGILKYFEIRNIVNPKDVIFDDLENVIRRNICDIDSCFAVLHGYHMYKNEYVLRKLGELLNKYDNMHEYMRTHFWKTNQHNAISHYMVYVNLDVGAAHEGEYAYENDLMDEEEELRNTGNERRYEHDRTRNVYNRGRGRHRRGRTETHEEREVTREVALPLNDLFD